MQERVEKGNTYQISNSSGDSLGVKATASVQMYQDVLDKKPRPSAVLTINHEITETTITDVIPKVLDMFSKAGYTFGTVAECLGMDPYLGKWDRCPAERWLRMRLMSGL